MQNKQDWEAASKQMSEKLFDEGNWSADKEDAPLSEMLSCFDEVLRKKEIKSYIDYLKDNNGYEEYFRRMIKSDFFDDNILKDSSGLLLALFMADKMPNMLQHKWPFSEKSLNEVMQVVGR